MVLQKELLIKNDLVVILCVVVLTCGMCFAQDDDNVNPGQMRIGSVDVAGNVSISKESVLVEVRARAGELFDKDSADEDAKRIAKLEGVEYAYYNAKVIDGQIQLTYVVVEKNLVRSITFVGNKKVKSGKLAKDAGFKRGDYLDAFAIGNSVDTIKELYLKKGYAFVEISLDEESLRSGKVVYNISEGPRVKVKKRTIEGNEALSTKEIIKALKTKTRKFWFWPVYYSEEVVNKDIAKLQEIFQEKGYLDSRVESTLKLSEDKRGAFVTFSVTEGPVYLVDSVVIKGNEFFSDDILFEDIKLKTGLSYSKDKSRFDIRAISRRYKEIGFIYVRVNYRRTFIGPGKVLCEFEVIEGGRFRIGEIVVTGNEATHDKVIRHILDEEGFRPGQWYNAEIARGDETGELEKIVKRTVYTESATIKPVGDKPDQRDARVSIAEGQTGSVMLGAGVSSNRGLIGQLVFDQRNFDITDWPESWKEFATGKAFKGAGQRFRISLEPGTRQDSFSISFTEPYLYDQAVSFNTTASMFERWQESHNEQRKKAYVGIEKRYDDDWRRGVSFRVENVEVSDLEADAPQEIRDIDGDTSLVGIRFSIRKDTTDSRFLPSRGYNFNSSLEVVAGDFNYGIASGTQRWYKTLYEDLAERKTVLETKIRMASILGDAPAFEKFYAGGSGSIRGFDYRGVSTRGLQVGPGVVNPQKKDPIGSDWLITANAEVAIPLTTEVLSALFFVDTGVIDTGGVRASIGTGIQILLPQWFGPVPMRFEFAIPIMKDDVDDTQVFSFTIGALF